MRSFVCIFALGLGVLLAPAPAWAEECRHVGVDSDGTEWLEYPFGGCVSGTNKRSDPWFEGIKKGPPSYKVVTPRGRDGVPHIFLSSQATSFSLNWIDKDFPALEGRTPVLKWSWRAENLPVGERADVRVGSRCDNGLQVLVAFDDGQTIISYVWDTNAPVDTRTTEGFKFFGLGIVVKVIVVQSGPGSLGSWTDFERDLAADFQAVYGRAPKRIRGFRVQSNSQYTGTEASGVISPLRFELSAGSD
ncbi:MAG: DUF3047 domain-containing protein [Deltaproteobacteria bacterium]|nr:DUF3047 domain-containing protein [Deltaproteobacteria bacterium]